MNRQTDLLGLNKMGKNIKKSPIHQPNFGNSSRQQPQPQVYNINKNDFRSIVQQLTGSPSHEPPPQPHQNPPKLPGNRLHRIRPPPLTPLNRHPMPIHPPGPVWAPMQPPVMAAGPCNSNFVRPPPQYGQPQPSSPMFPHTPSDVWGNITESPVSVYMRYLQNSMTDSGTWQPHPPQPQAPGQFANPPVPMNGHPPLPSPRGNGPLPPVPSPRMRGPPLPSPRINGPPPLLPSPASQFYLPSPTGFLNLLSPRSTYPLPSPGYQNPPLLSTSFSFSPMAPSGIVGPGPQASPGYGFPLSPSGLSPRWRDW